MSSLRSRRVHAFMERGGTADRMHKAGLGIFIAQGLTIYPPDLRRINVTFLLLIQNGIQTGQRHEAQDTG
jgi:hypothetical protein